MDYIIQEADGQFEIAQITPAVATSTVTTAIAAISALKDQAKCIHCDHSFTMTPDRIDCCARCSDDAS